MSTPHCVPNATYPVLESRNRGDETLAYRKWLTGAAQVTRARDALEQRRTHARLVEPPHESPVVRRLGAVALHPCRRAVVLDQHDHLFHQRIRGAQPLEETARSRRTKFLTERRVHQRGI